ncbi:MAG: beta-galactosidase [Polyangiaceae bacterium]|nr:beta-galactosidase [Polyangiaceae bacterium]
MPQETAASPGVRLVREGVEVAGEVVPLLAGSVHYWRLDPADWRRALASVRELGLRLVDTYVPWVAHETAPGEHDFGASDPRLDVARFLGIAHELGLRAIVRPGPHINGELTGFGVPERILWDERCQARSAGGRPVILPAPPLTFPVPSYASEAFLTEVDTWLASAGARLAPLCAPAGPIVLVQVDNEGSMYFRDGVYDQDYHPDAIARFRRFLQEKYGLVERLREAHGDPALTFAAAEPPRRLAATHADELAPHLDWAEFQEELLALSFARMRRVLERAGLAAIPTSHNFPVSETATPLDPARVGQVVDLVGLDYYHGASTPQRREIARRTTELALRSDAREQPAFACELGAGYPPFFPPLDERDNAFAVMAALAYGLRGFNLYMAVERDRWIGAPIDVHGRRRPSSDDWARLVAALERTEFARLRRRLPVRVVVPRSLRRLVRVCHAFGPVSAAFFQIIGGGAVESCFEDDFGLGGPVVIEAERFLRRLERALERARVPFGLAGGDLLEDSLTSASWTILLSTGALEDELRDRIEIALAGGVPVTLGPFAPSRDAGLRPRSEWRPPVPARAGPPALLPLDDAAIDDAVAVAVEHLGLGAHVASPAALHVTVHHDDAGRDRVLFVVNPSAADLAATVRVGHAPRATDALDGSAFPAIGGAIHLVVPARSVRMLELSPC